MPLPIEDFPTDKKLLCYVISPKIKHDGKDMWKFQPRHCANGITHILGSDLTESFVPILSAYPVSYSMAFSSSWNILGLVLDNTNSFQNTIIAPADIFYIPVPPYYLQWFMWIYLRINIKDIKWGRNVLQECNVIQGTKLAA